MTSIQQQQQLQQANKDYQKKMMTQVVRTMMNLKGIKKGGGGAATAFVDVNVNASWDNSSYDLIGKEYEAIRAGRIPASSFQDKLDRVRNDMTAHFETSGKIFEPIYVTEPKYDMVTYPGMYLLARLILGKDDKYLTHMACGTSQRRESRADAALFAEIFRVNMHVDGVAEAGGTTIFLSGRFPPATPSATIWEIGVFNQAIVGGGNGGVMFLRTAFTERNKIEHVQGLENFTVNQQVSLVSIL
jgi:hypothetical protein